MWNKVKKGAAIAAGTLASGAAMAQETGPLADLTEAVSDATTLMSSLQTLVIAGAVFGLVYSIFRRRGK